MIVDKIKNGGLYAKCRKGFDKAFAFLAVCAELPAGRYDIDGDNVYAVIGDITTVYKENIVYEAHKEYIDIQCVINGDELLYFANVGELSQTVEYDKARDIAFYEGDGGFIRLTGGAFAVLFPEDAHAGGIVNEASVCEKRVVIKVRVKYKKSK